MGGILCGDRNEKKALQRRGHGRIRRNANICFENNVLGPEKRQKVRTMGLSVGPPEGERDRFCDSKKTTYPILPQPGQLLNSVSAIIKWQ
jgi:hypothetical protein